jgi:hypothetical protein
VEDDLELEEHTDQLPTPSVAEVTRRKLVTMFTKTLPVALLAGAASAACPLSVAIANADNHVINVQVTNTGSETLQVFKGNTVFSDHATKDLLVADAGVYIASLLLRGRH